MRRLWRSAVAPATTWLLIQLLVGNPLYVYEAAVLTAMPPAVMNTVLAEISGWG